MSRNILFFAIGALVVAVGVLGYMHYQDTKEPEGIQINLGKKGVEVKDK